MESPPLRRLALALLAGTLVVGGLGIYQVAADGPRVLSLDYERTIPAFWSGGVLFLAALGAVLIARDGSMPGSRRPASRSQARPGPAHRSSRSSSGTTV